MEARGKNCIIFWAISLSLKIFQVSIPKIMLSRIHQTKRKPNANADLLTNIPRNRQKAKKPVSLIKYASKYSISEKTMEISVKSEKEYPRIIETMKRKKVEITANTSTVRNLDKINSRLLNPSIRFCFKVLLLYSLDIIETITIARNNFKVAAI